MFLIRSFIVKRTTLGHLKKVRRLPPEAQNVIAERVGRFINMAGVSDKLLGEFLEEATHDRHDALAAGARSATNPQWAIAALSEAWCMAKLGTLQGQISPTAGAAVMKAIEDFAFRGDSGSA
jgi:hypothetical protein